MSNPQPFVAVAGATGHLGSLIALNLRKRNIAVKALIRPKTPASRTQALVDAGVTIVEVDMTSIPSLTAALAGATTIISTLQGLRPVIFDIQNNLLSASLAAKVPRFIPSDFSLDFTKCNPGSNRNLDLRREFHVKLEESGIQWTSILNGAFMELLISGQMPLINDRFHRIMYFGSPDQKLDVTTVPDVAAFTAAVAADENPTPKFLRIAGDVFTPRELAETVGRVRGGSYKLFWTGSLGFLRVLIRVLKFFVGGTEDNLMPVWQGMQYMENMVSGLGKLEPLDNERYPGLVWTTVEKALRDADKERGKLHSS